MKKTLLPIVLLTLSFFILGPLAAPRAHADGFGITPPYLDNDSLTQNSHYEERILLVRSDPTQDLQAKVSVSVPGAGSWISIDKGTQFAMPAGVQQVPIIVSVDVPGDAKLGVYTGNIQVVVSPLNGPAKGTVGITIGAQIDVNLRVIDQHMAKFKVRRVSIANAEVGSSWWWMNFPSRVLFTMDIENDGNITASPDKVVFEYREYLTPTVLETETNTNGLAAVAPFNTSQVTAEMPAYLPVGSYKVLYTIYGRDDGDVIGQGSLDLSILPRGTLAAYVGYGFWGIRWQEKAITFGLIALVLLVIFLLVLWIKSGFRLPKFLMRKRARVTAPPPRPPEDY